MTIIINGTNTPTAGSVAVGDGTSLNFTAAGTAGQILSSNGASVPTWINNAAGTVTTASVVSANGFAGSVANASTTPAITLTTSITGLFKGNGTAISAAVAGTDYIAPPTGTALLKANSGGALADATAGTDYIAPPTGTALLKANSGGALADATAGTDYVAPATATSFIATQTFTGSTSALAAIIQDAAETVSISSNVNNAYVVIDVTTAAVWYFTPNATANWALNIRGSGGTALNAMMSIGQSVTIAALCTQGGTAYYNNSVQIDGTTTGVTTKWQGGTAPAAGNASSIDVYTYTIIKTAAATFTVLASQTKFA